MDVSTLYVAIGLLVSLAFCELFGLAAGGMVVPGYLALSLHRPADVVLTLAAALVTVAVVRGLSRQMIVYGRRKTVLTILVGFLVGAAIRGVPWAADSAEAAVKSVAVVGYIIPGLIAIWIDRQGMVETLSVAATSTVVVRLVLIVSGMEILA